MNPFEGLFKSKAFWSMVLTALISFLVTLVPALDTVRTQLLEIFLVLGSVLVGGFSVEAAAAAHGEAQVKAMFVQQTMAQGASPQATKEMLDDDKWRG